jgi:serine/threonine protein kinase
MLSGAAHHALLPDGSEKLALGSGLIDGLLGEGGMARVYRIWNEQIEGARAVKVMLPTERPELMDRFQTEIKISAKLHHPNIIETYMVGEWNGLPYIEMELVDGFSLAQLITTHGKLPPSLTVAVGIQIARALQYAHTQEVLLYGKVYHGIIHRDLKPANIMISKNGVVKLMDFGIARPKEVGLHTVSGNVVGTLPYLSPEQIDEIELDHRSDIYSFGTILFEALVGQKTFPQATATHLIKAKLINTYKKLDAFEGDFSPRLTKVVDKCIKQNRLERYSNALEVELALTTVLQTLTKDTSEKLLRTFLADPQRYEEPVGKKILLPPISLKVGIWGAAAALVIAAVVSLVLLVPARERQKPAVATAPLQAQAVEAVESNALDTSWVLPTDSAAAEHGSPKHSQSISQEVVSAPARTSAPPPPVQAQPSRVIKPAPVAAVTRKAASAASAPMRSAKVPELTALDVLKQKYKSDDVVVIGEAACNAAEFTEAIAALEQMSPSHAQSARGSVLLLWALVETSNLTKAIALEQQIGGSSDAFFLILRGRLAKARGKGEDALELFQQALIHPSKLRSARDMRSDALYYSAQLYDERYTSNPTDEKRLQAVMGWNSLKQLYSAQPRHPRFVLANKKLAEY